MILATKVNTRQHTNGRFFFKQRKDKKKKSKDTQRIGSKSTNEARMRKQKMKHISCGRYRRMYRTDRNTNGKNGIFSFFVSALPYRISYFIHDASFRWYQSTTLRKTTPKTIYFMVRFDDGAGAIAVVRCRLYGHRICMFIVQYSMFLITEQQQRRRLQQYNTK